MADKPNGADPAPAIPDHVIVVTFPVVDGRPDCRVEAPNVTPAEVYLAAWVLEALAREVRMGQVLQSAKPQLVGAPASILEELRRSGRV